MFYATARIGLPALAFTVLLTGACGGGEGDGAANDVPTDAPDAALGDSDGSESDTTEGDSADGTIEAFEEVYPVNQTFWHRGFMVEIGNGIHAVSEPDAFGAQEFTFTLEAAFTNGGDNQTFFDSVVTVVTPGNTLTSTFNSDLPSVAGGLTGSGAFLFMVDETFQIDDAYLVIGSGSEHQARVPLGPGGGELIALEPSDAVLSETMSNSLIDMNFRSAAVRADNPLSYAQMEADKLAVTLNFDVTSYKSGNWSVFPQEFALTLPSGSSVAVDGSDLPGLPGSEQGLDSTGLYLRFIVDDPVAGTYVLRWAPPDRWIGEGDPAEYTLELEL